MLALFLKQCQFSFARFGDTVLGVKRTEILAAATERFGRDGYEDTKWADIAADVGVGPTALYHYFGSKQHCLFMIMDEAAQLALSRFERSVATHTDPVDALQAAVDDAFDVEPADVQRLRVLVAEQGLMSPPRSSKREEEARLSARDRSRSLIRAWADCIQEAMDSDGIPAGAIRCSSRARSWGSTTAFGSGTARRGPSPSTTCPTSTGRACGSSSASLFTN